MYQFYYANSDMSSSRGKCKLNVYDKFDITAIRPAMWEEHCLECAAPLCFNNCVHYEARIDGRCKRFDKGINVYSDEKACCGQGAHIKFRKWANMMTIIFPSMLSRDEYNSLFERNQKRGERLRRIAGSALPLKLRWETIRTVEYLRRRKLRGLSGEATAPDAFIFHGYSYNSDAFNLIIEVYDDHTPKFKTSLHLNPGENLYILSKEELSTECWKPNNLIKVYPENDIEAELDILWCDFVCGTPIKSNEEESPASKVKCLVWDLDDTVWNGILIETDDENSLAVKSGVLETVKELDKRGIIQSIASKNSFESAWPVVEKIGLAEYVLYPQIHWNPKSGSLQQIAKSLNIGIDSLALIDDSLFERNQVKSVYPQVRVYNADELDKLLDYPEFQVSVTEESRNRRAMYRAEEKRNEIINNDNGDIVSFIKKSHLRMDVFEPVTDDEKMRCYELVVRTNQLNMSGKKYTDEEFEEVLQREGHKNFAFSCSDDFGDYGIVGFGQYRVEGETLVFTEFAMSCRVAGKYVESALFYNLLKAEECEYGYFDVIKTKKNILLRQTLENIGFETLKGGTSNNKYVFSGELKNKDIIYCVIK